MREDIETQREIYKADHNADLGNLKRLLRDCLRRNDASQQLSRLSPKEISALRGATNLVWTDKENSLFISMLELIAL